MHKRNLVAVDGSGRARRLVRAVEEPRQVELHARALFAVDKVINCIEVATRR